MSRLYASFVFLLTVPAVTTAMEFKQQIITVPSAQGWWLTSCLVDVDGDGLTDLLALLPAQNEMQIYRQRRSGFVATADQIVALPDQTAWVAMRDVDRHEGRELVISTAQGLTYLRQDGGQFDPSPRTLVEARQVFTADRLRIAANLPGGQDGAEAIPVIFEDHATWYEKDHSYTWHAGRTVDLRTAKTTWHTYKDYWMAGPTPAFCLEVSRSVRTPPQEGQAGKEDDAETTEQRLIDKITKGARWRHYDTQHQDVDGDGREDVVLWKTQGDFRPGTIILLLLRGQDGKLPDRPTRVLRHSGLPIRVDRKLGASPFWDLDGDGRCELILATLKTRVTSWSGLVDMALSGGVDWVLTVRFGRDGDYSGGPDFHVSITSMTPRNARISRLFLIDGDFNGDGREDILVERGPERFDLYVSGQGDSLYEAGPAFSFTAPVEARRVETTDLNGDGISDLFVQKAADSQITMYLSQSDRRKGVPK